MQVLIHGMTLILTQIFLLYYVLSLFQYLFMHFLRRTLLLLLSYSVGFEGGNLRICTFKFGFSIVLQQPQAAHWLCYSTVIPKREIFKFNLFQTFLSCIQTVFAIASGMICLWLFLEEVTGYLHCFFCLECLTIDSANCFLVVKINQKIFKTFQLVLCPYLCVASDKTGRFIGL